MKHFLVNLFLLLVKIFSYFFIGIFLIIIIFYFLNHVFYPGHFLQNDFLQNLNIFLIINATISLVLLYKYVIQKNYSKSNLCIGLLALLSVLNITWALTRYIPAFENALAVDIEVNFVILFFSFLIIPRVRSFLLSILEKIKKVDVTICQNNINLDYQKNRERFISLHPFLNKIPLLGRLGRWFYCEGWFYSLGLIFVVLVGFCLKLINIGELGYSTDEATAALYARHINNTGLPCYDDICYLRGLPYFYFIALFTKLFEINEFWVRVPNLIIFSALIVVIYFVIRAVIKNKNAALLAVFLISFADWSFMLARYARMYALFLLFLLVTIYFYYLIFYQNKKRFLPFLFVFFLLTILNHQFGLLLIFLILEPLLSRKFELYKNKYFLIFSFSLLVTSFIYLIKIPGIIYLNDNYLNIYDLNPELLTSDKYWYLFPFQRPDFTYLKYLLLWFPLGIIISLFFTLAQALNQNLPRYRATAKNIFNYFFIFVLIFLAIYCIDYIYKYLWWILVLLYIIIAISLIKLATKLRYLSLILVIIIFLSSIPGIYHILTRNYGENESSFPLLMSSQSELYHPDDQSPALYVANNYQEGDIIITDYWIQNIYLENYLNKRSDFFISHWDNEEALEKFPMYKRYFINGQWRQSKNGPVVINKLDELKTILKENKGTSLWLISGADFIDKKYLYISTEEIDYYLKTNFSDSIVYQGKDNNSKVYLIK